MAQPKRKPEENPKNEPAKPGHNKPPATIEATESVTFDGITLDVGNGKAVTEFVNGAVKLWRQGRRAIHLAAAVAVYHAQQYGDACHLQSLHDQFDPQSEKNLRSGLRAWCRVVATVEGETTVMEDKSEVKAADRLWLAFKDEKFKVKSKSEGYRKGHKTLQEIIDLHPFFQKMESEEKTFDILSFLKFMKGLAEKSGGQAEKAHMAGVPKAYLKPLEQIAAMATQDLSSITEGKQPVAEILAQRDR